METQVNITYSGLTDDGKETATRSQVRINSAETDDVIADDLLDLLRVTVIFPANFFLAFIGVVSNVINMVVQSRLGLNSSMTVGLFALSFTDFLVTSLQLIISVCYVLNKVYPDDVIDFWAVGVFVFSWVRYLCFFASGWITATISVERCFCVVSPFNVRRIFTVNRCLAAIAFIYAVHVSLVAPIYAVQKLTWAEVDSDDAGCVHRRRQEFTIVFTEEFIDMQVILNNVYAIGLSLSAQVLMIVCTIVMICSLRATAQIRITGEQSQLDSNDPRGSTLLSSRERKMVKVVLGLVVLLTSCNIPRYAIIAAYYCVTGMKSGSHKNLSDFLWDISDLLSVINCSTNFFVYLLLNRNFKNCFVSLLKPSLNHLTCTTKPNLKQPLTIQ